MLLECFMLNITETENHFNFNLFFSIIQPMSTITSCGYITYNRIQSGTHKYYYILFLKRCASHIVYNMRIEKFFRKLTSQIPQNF